MKKYIISSLILMSCLSNVASAGLMLAGSILTISSDNDKTLVTIGWTLIFVGILSDNGRSARADEVYNNQTEVAYFGNNGNAQNAISNVNLKQVLQETEMEAMLASQGSDLNNSLQASEFAETINIETAHLGQLIVKAKAFADTKLNNNSFAPDQVFVKKAELTAATGFSSEVDVKVLTNYLGLRNIQVL